MNDGLPQTGAETPRPDAAPVATPDPAPAPSPSPADPAQPAEPTMVPLAALREAREEMKRYRADQERAQQELAMLRGQVMGIRQSQPTPTPQPPPDPFVDFDGALKHHLTPVEQQLREYREELSRTRAEVRFGAETVNAAYGALESALRVGDPEAQALYQRATASRDPYGEIVQWHRQNEVRSKYGADPYEALRKMEAQLAAFQAAGGAPPQPGAPQPVPQPGVMPSPIAGGRSAGPRGGAGFAGPQPLSAIMKR